MTNRQLVVLFLFFMLNWVPLHAQTGRDSLFTIDTPVNLDFEHEEEPIHTKKKKKRKRKVFYGLKTKKGFTRRGYGDRVTYETFYYLKKTELPKTFVRDLYWYDFTRHEIRRSSNFDPKKGVLLHGPYEKRQGDVLLEKGIFFKGTKHGRWMQYNRDSVLVDKERYYKGWPKESLAAYFDPSERTRLKEIIPIEFGDKEGYYYMFYEDGRVAVTGEYHWDHKVGDWTEYYPDGKRKRVISYPKDAYEDENRPYVKTEWNEKGREIYRNIH